MFFILYTWKMGMACKQGYCWYTSVSLLLSFLSLQGLSFLQVVDQIWSHRCVSDDELKGQFSSECQKWVLLLLQLIDVTGTEAATHLYVFIKGRGVTKTHREIIKKTVSALCDNFNVEMHICVTYIV